MDLGLVPLKGMAMLRKTLNSLSADRWGCVPVLLVVWPKASHHEVYRLSGTDNGSLWEGLWQCVLPRITTASVFGPHHEPQPSPGSSGDPPILTDRSDLVSYEVTNFFSCVHGTLHVSSKSRISVYPSPVDYL